MSLSMTCRHCGIEITVEDDDQLVDQVQAHAIGHGKELSREHILHRHDVVQRHRPT